ncbi:MAG: glycosyltransferase family 4 protein [Caldilineaceae bacterium]
MRICMVTSAAFPAREGMGFYIWNLSKQLMRMGHDVQIITRGSRGRTTRATIEGITVWAPTFVPAYPFHVHWHSIFVDKLVKCIESEIDLFHLHTPLVRQPQTRRATLVTVHTPMKADAGAVRVDNLLGLLVKLQAPISCMLEQRIFDNAHKLTAVSHSVAQELADYGVDSQAVSVLGNGVDTDVFTPLPTSTNQHRPYFISVARLAPRKGLHDLIACAKEVLAMHPNHRFLIAGSGPLEGELRAQIKRHNLADKIVLLGHIGERQRLIELYQNAVAFVHAAHYEGLPTVLLEAMACGCPTISTAISGALDVVQDGENGLLVPIRDPHAMAQAIQRLIDDQALQQQLGAAARATVEDKYAWRVVSRNYVAEYEQIVKECVH